MRVPSGAPVGDGNMGTVVKDLRSQIDVLSRRLSRLPKPEVPASGGIVDIAMLSTTATFPSFAGVPWLAGQSDAEFLSTLYDTPTSTVTGDAVDWLTIDLGGISPTEDGFYQAWCNVYFQWDIAADGPGAAVQVYLNGRDVPSSEDRTVHEVGTGAAVLSAYVTNGPEWMTTSDTWRLELDGYGVPTADVSVSSATWRITKYGAS